MERQTFIERPDVVLDLGSGNSNVHLNVTEVDMPEMGPDGSLVNITKYQADVVRVSNPVTRDKVIAAIIKNRFTDDFREAALRKGILNPNDSDYILFNDYAESIKNMCASSDLV